MAEGHPHVQGSMVHPGKANRPAPVLAGDSQEVKVDAPATIDDWKQYAGPSWSCALAAKPGHPITGQP